MSLIRRFGRVVAIGVIMMAGAAHASNDPAMDAQLLRINKEWARIKYQVADKSQQYAQLDKLSDQAAQIVAKYPGRAEPLLWQGVVTSEEAAQASVFRQLGLATSARDILEKAYRIDPKAANGALAMSLGVLYYKVPGWPIGFGNAKKARAFLDQALAADPNGLDANWFYGDYLVSQGDKARARVCFRRALAAPVDPDRPIWDAGRRGEVRSALAKLG